MLFGSLDGGDDGEYNGNGLVQISKIFTKQDDFFNGVILFDRVLRPFNPTSK